jgi:hypothetical protein
MLPLHSFNKLLQQQQVQLEMVVNSSQVTVLPLVACLAFLLALVGLRFLLAQDKSLLLEVKAPQGIVALILLPPVVVVVVLSYLLALLQPAKFPLRLLPPLSPHLLPQ